MDGDRLRHEFMADHNIWTHVGLVFIRKSNQQEIQLYNNGTRTGTVAWPTGWPTGDPSGVLKIGRQFDGRQNSVDVSAEVDELMFWNRALTQPQITKIAKMARAGA